MRGISFLVFLVTLALLGNLMISMDLIDENRRLKTELTAIRNAQAEAEKTTRHLTHPETIQRRTIDWILQQGEFKEAQ